MKHLPAVHPQRGATLVVGLIMLAVITLTVVTAFTLNSSNLKSVANMQLRNEAIAAANKAIEQVIGSSFTTAPTAEDIDVDINNDGVIDYTVNIQQPQCIRAQAITSSSASDQENSLALGFSAPPPSYNTMWDIDAVVTDAANGTSVRMHQGVRVVLTNTQYNAVCA